MCEPIVHPEKFDEEIYAWNQKRDPVYDQVPDEQDVIFSVEEFVQTVISGGIIDDDGFGYPVKNGKYAVGRNIGMSGEHIVLPSKISTCIPSDATHIIWYDK